MDPLVIGVSFVAILSSISSLTLNTYELLRRAKKSSSELESQLDEIQVVREVLEECYVIVRASQNTKIPPSVDRALHICERRSAELAECMMAVCELKLHPKSKIAKWRRTKTLMLTENERKAAFNAFRSVVLLLRDLCSDIRLQQQLVNMSAGLAELLADRYDEATSQRAEALQPGHIYMDGGEDDLMKDELNHPLPSDTLKPWRKGNSPGPKLMELITQNFTRNATIVLDSGAGALSERVKYVHLRAKMDTGCNENLITLDLFNSAQIDKSLLVEIPEEDQFELTMIEGAKCTPMYKIPLTWYQDGDMKMRHSEFYVVRDGPFDMLIGSHRFAQDFDEHSHPGLLIGKRGKKKADRKREKAAHARHLREQQSQEIQERNVQRAQAALQGQAPPQGHGTPKGQVQVSQGLALPPVGLPAANTLQAPQGQASQAQAPGSANQPASPSPPVPAQA